MGSAVAAMGLADGVESTEAAVDGVAGVEVCVEGTDELVAGLDGVVAVDVGPDGFGGGATDVDEPLGFVGTGVG